MNNKLRKNWSWALSVAGVVFILSALVMLTVMVQNQRQFEKLYDTLLVLNTIGLGLILLVLLGHMWRLYLQYQQQVAGTLLRGKLVFMFVLSTLIPVSLVYVFSIKLLNSGIDSWFNIHITQALDNSYELGQVALDERKKRLLRETTMFARELGDNPRESLFRFMEDANAYSVSLLDQSGKVLAFSHSDSHVLVPDPLGNVSLAQVKSGNPFLELESHPVAGNVVRIVTQTPEDETRFLQVIYQMPERIYSLLSNVNQTSQGFQQVERVQPQLRRGLTITLSLVLLLSIVSAIMLAFYFARKIATPVIELARGTRSLADGNYAEVELAGRGRDEMAFLVESFNTMVGRVKTAQMDVRDQNAFLDSILTNLSSAVMVLDDKLEVVKINDAARNILGEDAGAILHHELAACGDHAYWEHEITGRFTGVPKTLRMRVSRLPKSFTTPRRVVVIDDITKLIEGQRNAAWSEVARRLAHEITNPLTPIQLSAERIRNKCLTADNQAIIERGTQTIITQVEALKKMVRAFSEYARAPKMECSKFDLVDLVCDVVELYKSDKTLNITIQHEHRPVQVHADSNRLRQLLHNLIKNAKEQGEKISVTIHILREQEHSVLEVCDNGGGIDDAMLDKVFEPYVSGKPKGSGLGLAIVKRIAEEHRGSITAYNQNEGACFRLMLESQNES
jgi:nitrogen fixation/metabolism regulation signal transduction histidine kinase